MAVATYTKSGTKSATPAKLDKSIFGLEVKSHQLLKDAYVIYLGNQTASTAKTKHRGEVSGGGSKPWRQKGTGRARFGSSRNPIWRGGGSAFGPTGTQNSKRSLNQKAKQQALKQALSLAAKEDKVKVIESLAVANGKVREILSILKKIDATDRTILITTSTDDKLKRSVRNISNVDLVASETLNVADVLNADNIVITKEALETLQSRLVKPAEASK